MIRTRGLSIFGILFVLAAGLLAPSYYHHTAKPGTAVLAHSNSTSLSRQSELLSAYGKLPLDFELNQGQTDSRVKFLSRNGKYALFLTQTDATLVLPAGSSDAKQNTQSAVLRLALEGSNQHSAVTGLDLQPGVSSYFIGNDPAKWHRGIPHYARVKYQSVYPGIDLVYYGNQGQLESDYVVSPGADPHQIALRVDGASSLKIDSQGNLVLSTSASDLSLHRPVAYQNENGARKPVDAQYIRRGPRSVGIEVASYDSRQPLIIDPVVVYSTYLGGTGKDVANALAVDSSGNAYITGWTNSTDFPTKTPLPNEGTFGPPTGGTNQEAFVTKMNATGSALVYSTYLGGTSSGVSDQGFGIAVDSSNDAIVVGTTIASDFPLANPYQSTILNTGGTAFVSKLDPTGTTLLYSTFLTGHTLEAAHAVAVDVNGLAYVTGVTESGDFPIVTSPVAPFQAINNSVAATPSSAFVSVIDSTKVGTGSLVYSTYFGGTGAESGNAIAVDSSGNVYFTGDSTSTDLLVKNAFQSTNVGGAGGNAYIAQLNTTVAGQSALVYCSYLGGTGTPGRNAGGGDLGNGIALGPGGNVFVTGKTGSNDFPVFPNPGAFQTKQPSLTPVSAFVARFDTTKSGAASLIYSTYFGGSNFTKGLAIAVDSQNNAYISGSSGSNDLPVTAGAPQALPKGQNTFLTVFNPTGTGLVFSTYWGGDLSDVSNGMAIDKANPPNLYMGGSTTSDTGTFPTTPGAFQLSRKGLQDAFIAKFTPAAAATQVTLTPGTLAFGNQPVNSTSAPQNATLTNGGSSQLTGISASFSGANSTDFAFAAATTCPTTSGTLNSGKNCVYAVDFTPRTQAAESATLSVATNVGPQVVNLTGTGTGAAGVVSVNPTSLNFGTLALNTSSTPQTVTLTNNTTTAMAGIAITVNGANPADFTQAPAGTCTTTLAASANCTINITFKPTMAALEQAALNIAFTGPTGSPLQVALSGTGSSAPPDFSITATGPTGPVPAGQSATFSVTITSLNGFNSAVNVTCSGAPAGAACTLTPKSATPAPNGTSTISGSLSTTKRTMAPPLLRLPSGPRFLVPIWGLVSLMLALLAVWTAVRRARKLSFACGVLMLLSLSGCSGLPHAGTPAGSYTITINAASGASQHKATVSITVS